jgi:benzoyl-CoA reductase/2-hydroxyglutaryl-CoA dehydratase subunit BcrC/BadD/HgdB
MPISLKPLIPYVLDCLEGAVEGGYNFLEGVIVANVSDAHRRLYDVWRLYGEPRKVFFLDVPKGSDKLRVKTFSLALKALNKEMESAVGVEISSEALQQNTKLCNETRALLQEIATLRKQKRPPLSGQDFFELVRWVQRNDKSHANLALRKIIQELKEAQCTGAAVPRLMLMVGLLGSTELISLIEKLGARSSVKTSVLGCNTFRV